MAEEYADMLGPVVAEYPLRFAELLNAGLAESLDPPKRTGQPRSPRP